MSQKPDTAKMMSKFTSVVILADKGVTKCRFMPKVSWYSLVYSFMILPVNCWSSPPPESCNRAVMGTVVEP